MARRTKILIAVVAILGVAGLTVWGITSGEETVDPGAANPQSRAVDYERALADAPPALAELYAEGDALIPGGVDELQAQIDRLSGFPVVVNVWASWCGPCRVEFPDFQQVSAERGDEIAFLGVDALDTDPDEQVRREYGIRGYPATAFFNAEGELVHLKQGPYTSAQELEADIDQYIDQDVS